MRKSQSQQCQVGIIDGIGRIAKEIFSTVIDFATGIISTFYIFLFKD
jgi:hypothetical protein